jgi:glycosyltransferase involved in cell wall biosynthesis
MEALNNKVLFLPDWRESNPYLDLLAEALSRKSIDVVFAQFPKGYFKFSKLSRQYPRVRIFHVHWTIGLFSEILWSKSPVKRAFKYFLFFVDCLFFRIKGVRIVWTVHNLYEHESEDTRMERQCRKLLFFFSHRVIVHSNGAGKAVCEAYTLRRSEKLVVIPHGNYLSSSVCLTPPRFGREAFGLSSSTTVLLFFGMIRRYKGLEDLLSAFVAVERSDMALIVAGKSLDKELSDRLHVDAGRDPRIIVQEQYIPDEHVSSFFALADAVILPFKKTLTSGSVVLAMGFGKPLILPSTARLLDIPGEQGGWYYDDEEDLKSLLSGISKEDAQTKGQININTAKSLNWDRIASETVEAYRVNR